MPVKVSRKTHFNAAHRLHNPSWSQSKNQEVFGLCNNPNYHGHNYELIVSVSGEIDLDTGFVINMNHLKDLLYRHVESAFDHKNLNLDVPEFQNLNPTAENITVVIWRKLRPYINSDLDLEVTLFETARNSVFYKG